MRREGEENGERRRREWREKEERMEREGVENVEKRRREWTKKENEKGERMERGNRNRRKNGGGE